ncbi:MAG: hypothetical protein HYV60_23465 [Planctomycetia bacterium]|nr:hypothetical protein [Planctomycetia bacterium]
MPNSCVLSISQDREGHLWFGTPSGASRYDGKAFVTSFAAHREKRCVAGHQDLLAMNFQIPRRGLALRRATLPHVAGRRRPHGCARVSRPRTLVGPKVSPPCGVASPFGRPAVGGSARSETCAERERGPQL